VPKKSKNLKRVRSDFSDFITDPPIQAALVVFALIALFLAILEFGQTVYQY